MTGTAPGDGCDRVVLTGFMGTGKTTVGRLLAGLLGWEACDTDELIVEQHGPIADIFELQGESAFRELEREVSRELAQATQRVISTGGALLLDKENAELLSAKARVFCLTAQPAEVARRLSENGTVVNRPLLSPASASVGQNPEQPKTLDQLLSRIEQLQAERAAGYEDFEQVPTDGLSPQEVAVEIYERLAIS